ncbi:hypothetical protein [Paludisphaera mucosa]|uniref:Uncharacterized protein n=1 Tax=Paludisphaera mucosa TaxID=3030827 RepID=A0ABT6F973_9BACT|nr:hypothetical protein [Paludisphaera mucosa]MDG3004122.1 hypothetical protein [Paludisphaera mucosa]
MRAVVIVLAAVPFLTSGFAPRREAVLAPRNASGAEVHDPADVPVLSWLPAGTRFRDDRPPADWSDVVLKSTPALTSGDLDTVSKEAFATARRLRLVILADVARKSDAAPYAIRRLGVGLSAPIVGADGGDVVVAATNVGDASGSWSTKERIILAAGSRELGRAKLAAATPTFAILRTPTTCLVGARHETLDVLYAVLVEPASGRLRLFVCKPAAGGAPSVVRELEAPAIVDGPLHVRAKTFAGIPISWSFAMIDVPEGAERAIPDELARLIAPDRLETADARVVEGAFRAFAERPALTPTARAADASAAQGD